MSVGSKPEIVCFCGQIRFEVPILDLGTTHAQVLEIKRWIGKSLKDLWNTQGRLNMLLACVHMSVYMDTILGSSCKGNSPPNI